MLQQRLYELVKSIARSQANLKEGDIIGPIRRDVVQFEMYVDLRCRIAVTEDNIDAES